MALFLKNKDLIFRRFKSVETYSNKITIHTKDGSIKIFYVIPFPQNFSDNLEKIRPNLEGKIPGLVVVNTKKNFDAILKEWEKLVKFHKQLCIYFVNPFSIRAKHWAIHPSTHQTITGGEGLKIGLTALFNTVDETDEQEMINNLKEEDNE